MKGIFDLDAPIVQAVGKLGVIMLMSFYWAVCCLPIITAGASTAAMYQVMFRLKEERSCRSWDFFQAFRENLKRGTAGECLILASGAVVFAYYAAIVFLNTVIWLKAALLFPFCLGAFLWMGTSLYLLPLIAYFENTLFGTVKTAFGLAFGHLRTTVRALALTILPFLAYLVSPYWFFAAGALWILVFPGLIFYWKAGLYHKLFFHYSGQE